MRGWLNDEHGVKLTDVHWYQAGTNEPGRTEKVELSLPKASSSPAETTQRSATCSEGRDRLRAGGAPADWLRQGPSDVVRLFPDFLDMEESTTRTPKVWRSCM